MSDTTEVSEAQRLMQDVLRKHRIGWYGDHDRRCMECPGTHYLDADEAEAHIAAEIDEALGVLFIEKSWRVGRLRGIVLDSPHPDYADDAEVIATRWASRWKRTTNG